LKVTEQKGNPGPDQAGEGISSEFVGSLKQELYELKKLLED